MQQLSSNCLCRRKIACSFLSAICALWNKIKKFWDMLQRSSIDIWPKQNEQNDCVLSAQSVRLHPNNCIADINPPARRHPGCAHEARTERVVPCQIASNYILPTYYTHTVFPDIEHTWIKAYPPNVHNRLAPKIWPLKLGDYKIFPAYLHYWVRPLDAPCFSLKSSVSQHALSTTA